MAGGGIDFGAHDFDVLVVLVVFSERTRENTTGTRKIRQGFPSYFCWGSSKLVFEMLKMSGEVLQVHRDLMSLHLELCPCRMFLPSLFLDVLVLARSLAFKQNVNDFCHPLVN